MFSPKLYNFYEREFFDFTKDKRNKRKCLEGKYFYPEFGNIKKFRVDEKIDGTNIRIEYIDGKKFIGGRTVNSQIPPGLLDFLNGKFTDELLARYFLPTSRVVLFGEGIGPKIQGNPYEKGYFDFVLFDINIDGWWLEKENVMELGRAMNVSLPPDLGILDENEIVEFVKSQPKSQFGGSKVMEGIVARSEPQLYKKNGERVIFKLRCVDFELDKAI